MVEIDAQVVEVSKRFFPGVGTRFDDARADVVHDDGAAFVANTREKFDVVLSDTSDPIGPAEVLFQRSYYQGVYDALNEDGIFVAQTESPLFHADSIRKIYKNLSAVFPVVKMYLATVPTYPGFVWSFAFCSKGLDPLDGLRAERGDFQGLRYYNADVHRASFALPNYVRELL